MHFDSSSIYLKSGSHLVPLQSRPYLINQNYGSQSPDELEEIHYLF